MKSKIKSITFKKEWTGTNGTIYYHDIAFEDGTSGQVGAKTKMPEKLAVGAEHEYALDTASGYNKIKIIQPQGGYNKPKFDPVSEDKKQRMIVAQSSISSAIKFIGEGQGLGAETEKVFELAGKFYDWVMEKGK